MSPRKDTRCALRELTRESRVLAMKHSMPKNVREKDSWDQEKQINEERQRRQRSESPIIFPLVLNQRQETSRSCDDTWAGITTLSIFIPRVLDLTSAE